jgi:hypothetical protein
VLREAYSPGGPGAILFFETERERLEEWLGSLSLVREGLVVTETIELHPLAGLASA